MLAAEGFDTVARCVLYITPAGPARSFDNKAHSLRKCAPPGGVLGVRGRRDFSTFDPRPGSSHLKNWGSVHLCVQACRDTVRTQWTQGSSPVFYLFIERLWSLRRGRGAGLL